MRKIEEKLEGRYKEMNERNLNEGQWEDRKQWSLGVGQRRKTFWNQYIYIYTGCPRRNVPNFGRVFLMLKYTDITQNTYIQSWTVTEIMVWEKCGLLAAPPTVPVKLTPYSYTAHVRPWECNEDNIATAM
jgi:hypothetical protein